jgi:cysteinyl-tRNA synthetase
MARKYLGDTFDIHGGGVDLRFPHHENEQAQSRAAGLGFANYWLHNAWVTMGGEKMSKSLGNSLRVSGVLQEHRALAVRYYLTAAHYRSTIEFHEGSIEESATAVERIEGFLRRALPDEVTAVPTGDEPLPEDFREAMDDDLGVSGALAVVHEAVRSGNISLDDGDHEDAVATARTVIAMTDVLGVNPLDPAWAAGDSTTTTDALASLDALVRGRIAARAQARSSRDYDTADAIRDELAAAGIALEDTAAGARWSLVRGRGE